MQNPVVHGTPSQQSPAVVQRWPYCAQFVEPGGGGVGPPVVPESGVPTAVGPHVPLLDPCGITHGEPAQQSAVVVHAPLVGTHAVPHTKGGEPEAFGRQGFPQQSALDAHAVPAGGGPFAAQS